MQDNVDDFVEFADVFCRDGHQAVHNFAEEHDISTSIANDARHKLRHCFLMLQGEFNVVGWDSCWRRTSDMSSRSMTNLSCSRFAICY